MKQATYFIVLCLFTGIVSCKKKKTTPDPEPDPVVNCDIITSTLENGHLYTYEYDAQDRVIKLFVDSTLAVSMEYSDDGKTITETETSRITTYTLDNAGRLHSFLKSENTGYKYKRTYSYDANGYPSQFDDEDIDPQNVSSFDTMYGENTVANSNCIKNVFKKADNTVSSTVNTTHDLAHLNIRLPRYYLPNDILNSGQDKNLTKTRTVVTNSNNYSFSFTYEFDAKGRPIARYGTAIVNSQTQVDTVLYTYRCN